MSDLVRFSVSLEADLLEKFDKYCDGGRFATRSEGIRQLLHRALVDEAWDDDAREAMASLTIVYDHHRPGLVEALLDAQHSHAGVVVANLHVHLDHAHCLEVIILRGSAKDLQSMASRLRGLKGIRCGDLAVAHVPGIGGEPHAHPHRHHPASLIEPRVSPRVRRPGAGRPGRSSRARRRRRWRSLPPRRDGRP